jgi:hypothetical protein
MVKVDYKLRSNYNQNGFIYGRRTEVYGDVARVTTAGNRSKVPLLKQTEYGCRIRLLM